MPEPSSLQEPTSLAEQQEAVTAAFTEMTGRSPAGLWAAPGRVNLIGEHTDYNDGFVLPFAIDRQVVVAAAPRDDGQLRVSSLQEDEEPRTFAVADLSPDTADGWTTYVAGVVWVLRERGVQIPGLDLVLHGTVPVGSGLSSSAALECATGIALDDLFGVGDDAVERALVAQQAENDFAGVPVGAMDQLASTLGRAGSAIFLDTRSLDVELLPLRPASAGLALLVIDTRVSHSLKDGAYADRRAACESAAAELGVAALRDVSEAELPAALERLDDERGRRVRHIVTENARVQQVADLLRAEDFAAIGPLMTASHVSLRDDYEVSAPELDTAVDAALGAGAVGARMTGAGFGGCAIALVPEDRADAVRAAVAADFERHGYGEPAIFPAVPSDGARRLGAGEGAA